jgi:hypothetical protein
MKLVLVAAILAIAVALTRRPIELTVPAPMVITVRPTDESHTIRVTKKAITYGGRLVAPTGRRVQTVRVSCSTCW